MGTPIRTGDVVAFDVDGTEWQGVVRECPGPRADWADRVGYSVECVDEGVFFEVLAVRPVRGRA